MKPEQIIKLMIQRVIIDLVCSWRCPVNDVTGISFLILLYGENANRVAEEYLAAIPQVATWQHWTQS